MSVSRVAWLGASGAAGAWAAKAVAIAIAGGLDKSPVEAPLFLLGLMSALVGAAALGASLTPGKSTWVRVVAAAGGVVALIAVAIAGGAAAQAAQPADPGWAWGEINLWVSALVLVSAVWLADRRRRHRQPGKSIPVLEWQR